MRKKKSLYNIVASVVSYFVSMICTFVTQALIVKMLGIEYSGINGLFSNIITMLSVAELGIGTTIIFKLYKPIADNDIEKIKTWLNFYKICYRMVALVIFIVGAVMIPIVPIIVGEICIQDNIIVLYLITLLDTVFSYVMTYKRSLLYADQKNYIINIIHMGYTILLNVTQILVLLFTQKYILFLIVKLIYRLLENAIINIYVNSHYEYVKEKAQKINQKEKKDIIERIRAIFLQKISFVINKGIDSITISCLLGVTAVGYYTNYNLVATTICAIIYQVISGFGASVGNMLTLNDKKKNFDVYKKINMINSYITGMAIIGFICCIQPFITLWVGKKFVLDYCVIISFGVYIYSDSIRRTITIFKEAAGICKEDKYIYIIMALINFICSIILCKVIGISGVILGTAISYLFLIFYSYPKYIFKPVFKEKIRKYYNEALKYILFIISALIFAVILQRGFIINNSLLKFIINGASGIIIYNIIFIILFRKTSEYKYYLNLIKNFIMKFKKV